MVSDSATASAAAIAPAALGPAAPLIGSRDKNVQWYKPTLETLDPVTRELLETYSKIPEDQVIPHIYEVRDRAWEIWPYPCIGQFRFLDLSIVHMPSFTKIVTGLQDGQKFLDVGCCFGQDLRGLVGAGAPGTSLHGADLHGQFHTMGYELFKDKDTLGAKLVEADLFEDGSLKEIEGTIDFLQVCAFLHLFNWDKQFDAAKRLVKILSDKKGSMILGRMAGNAIPQLYEHDRMFLHNVGSFEKFWAEVSKATDTKWEVRATVSPDERQVTPDQNSRWLEIEVERL